MVKKLDIIKRLLKASEKIFKKYNEHPFILGIQDGTLDKNKFRYYIIQDYLYLEDFAKTFAIGVAKAKSRETANLFAKYVSVINGEMNVHSGYLALLGVTSEEILNTPRSLENLSYTSYMLRVAYEESEAEILAAILPCTYSYEKIAKTILKNKPESINNSFYGDWIKSYSGKDYEKENEVLIKEINRLTKNFKEEKLKHLEDIFFFCSLYELDFWEMAWRGSTPVI